MLLTPLLVLASLLLPVLAGAQERESPIASTLAVQTALQQGRDHLLRNNAQAAVYVLEGQLARINGSREYLTVLRDAYRAYIKELRLANKEAEAEDYLKRLRILDPGAILDGSLARSANALVPAMTGAATKPAAAEMPKTPTVRGKGEDDPFRPENAQQPSAPLAQQAEQEFRQRHYEQAGKLFAQASQSKVTLSAENREQWGYCKLHQVVEQLNDAPANGLAYADLEREVRSGVDLAPRLEDYGKGLLKKIQERTGDAGGSASVPVRHLDRQADGWYVAETANFRIYHQQSRELAEKAAQVAERTRAAMQRKWFGEVGEDWNPRCDLYLYASGQDYSRATGVPANSPGHSTMRTEGTRVIGRRMDLHCDDPNMLIAVLPHETTHVVLAGRFGDAPVPRWADEGMAVLTEPRDKIERHLRNLPQYRRDRQLFGLRQLVQLNDYPDPRYVGAFYAESVSLVDYLTHEKGPQTFAQFLQEGLRGGYEPALKKYYGFSSFNELQDRWQRFAFNDAVASGVAERGR